MQRRGRRCWRRSQKWSQLTEAPATTSSLSTEGATTEPTAATKVTAVAPETAATTAMATEATLLWRLKYNLTVRWHQPFGKTTAHTPSQQTSPGRGKPIHHCLESSAYDNLFMVQGPIEHVAFLLMSVARRWLPPSPTLREAQYVSTGRTCGKFYELPLSSDSYNVGVARVEAFIRIPSDCGADSTLLYKRELRHTEWTAIPCGDDGREARGPNSVLSSKNMFYNVSKHPASSQWREKQRSFAMIKKNPTHSNKDSH